MELMIVVVIILIISGIAIPNYLTSRKLANEAAAVAEIKTINTAQATYLGASRTFGTIPDLIAAKTLDPRFSGTLSGYNFNITIIEGDYVVDAAPSMGINGRYAYSANSDGIVRYSTDAALAPPGLAGMPLP
jgi:type II secretory pathway pseudopilin PulG